MEAALRRDNPNTSEVAAGECLGYLDKGSGVHQSKRVEGYRHRRTRIQKGLDCHRARCMGIFRTCRVPGLGKTHTLPWDTVAGAAKGRFELEHWKLAEESV
jgi:hypothetical protein